MATATYRETSWQDRLDFLESWNAELQNQIEVRTRELQMLYAKKVEVENLMVILTISREAAYRGDGVCSCNHSRSDHIGTVPADSNDMPCIRCSCSEYKPEVILRTFSKAE